MRGDATDIKSMLKGGLGGLPPRNNNSSYINWIPGGNPPPDSLSIRFMQMYNNVCIRKMNVEFTAQLSSPPLSYKDKQRHKFTDTVTFSQPHRHLSTQDSHTSRATESHSHLVIHQHFQLKQIAWEGREEGWKISFDFEVERRTSLGRCNAVLWQTWKRWLI